MTRNPFLTLGSPRNLIVASALLVFGCGDDENPATATLTLQLVNEAASELPVVGARACVVSPSGFGCATSNSNSIVSLQVPPGVEVIVEVTRDEFASTSVQVQQDTDRTVITSMIPQQIIDGVFASLEMSEDTTKGHVLADLEEIAGGDVSGLTFSLTPAGGIGPIYFNGNTPEPTETTTTVDGVGAYLSLEPGEYMFSWTPTTLTCANTLSGWRPTETGSVKIQVRAANITAIELDGCE